jgi:hypothetical protein
MGITNGTHAEQLPSAKVLQTRLDMAEAQVIAQNELLRRLTAVLAAVLIDQHRGRLLVDGDTVDAMYGDPTQANGYMVDVQTIRPLGKHRLQVMLPNGSTYVPAPVLVYHEDAAEICEDASHKRGTGLRCEECGKLLEKRV